ncbi:chromosomal replication initiator DnaA [Rhodobaculum claviforme]|uniref:Chromosomal replication initiator DnaA n=1 Tax=Rhodobaculum claviforme TaxID=1549854 RepID=A0A934TNB7_9RHOB|nr:chromosomal replication initiator DnaA [Rhodobaculum claviforme]MBK5928794.1 chromosomal replication initiator DnaA [Rhodobaculum claviforme]
MRQLAFDLPAPPSLRRDDFFVAPSNALALRTVEGWADWPGGKLALAGPAGSGKTHLAHIWAAQAGAVLLPGAALAGADIGRLAARARVAVEDASDVAGDPAAERALFHLHNLILAEGGRLMLTDAAPPARWPVGLPDLASRLAATPTAALEAPDDALLSAVLVKLFADRQVAVPAALIPWMVARMERSLAAARDLVARIDARALAEGRPVSRPLAAAVLDSPPDLGP